MVRASPFMSLYNAEPAVSKDALRKLAGDAMLDMNNFSGDFADDVLALRLPAPHALGSSVSETGQAMRPSWFLRLPTLVA